MTRCLLTLFILLSLVLQSCGGKRQAKAESSPDGKLDHARTLTIYREGDCSVARVMSAADSTVVIGTYIFPDSDTVSILPKIDKAVILPPSKLSNLMVYSTVYTSALKELGALGAVKVVGDASYFSMPEIKQGLAEGLVADGGTQQAPVKERIIQAAPGAIILSCYEGMDASAIERLGIPIIYMNESNENSPLGRAEWIKMLGLIARNRAGADSIFSITEKNYSELRQVAANAKKQPKVLCETMYQGVWNVAGGDSYAARLIADAGGDYPWKEDTHTGSLQLPFESVLAKASDADVWLIRLFDEDFTLDYLREADKRYMLFDPAKRMNSDGKQIWTVNTAKVPFFDETPFHPDLVLKDYIAIFHPELLPGFTPRYFTKATK